MNFQPIVFGSPSCAHKMKHRLVWSPAKKSHLRHRQPSSTPSHQHRKVSARYPLISEMPLFRKFPEIRKFQIEGKNFRKNETVSLDENDWSKGGKVWKKGKCISQSECHVRFWRWRHSSLLLFSYNSWPTPGVEYLWLTAAILDTSDVGVHVISFLQFALSKLALPVVPYNGLRNESA